MRALGFGKAPTRGIVNGEVVSRDELVLRFVDAIATAETKADERASKVIFSMQFETLDKEKAKNEIIKTFKQVSFKRSDIEFSEKPFVVKI